MALLKIRESFMFGGTIHRKGDLVEDTDPLAETHAHFLETPEPTRPPRAARPAGIEEATAEPGAKRDVTAPPSTHPAGGDGSTTETGEQPSQDATGHGTGGEEPGGASDGQPAPGTAEDTTTDSTTPDETPPPAKPSARKTRR